MNKLIKLISTISVFLILSSIFCCAPKDNTINIRTEPGIEYCSLACDKMQKLYENGEELCYYYVETILVDGKEMNCEQFCKYEHNNSIQLGPKCIYEEANSCAEIPEKCEE